MNMLSKCSGLGNLQHKRIRKNSPIPVSLLKSIVAFLCIFAPLAALAITPTPWTDNYETGWADDTRPNHGYFANPKDACLYQMEEFDPLATNQEPISKTVSTGQMRFSCVWTNRHNTVLPGQVTFRCVSGLPNGKATTVYAYPMTQPPTSCRIDRPFIRQQCMVGEQNKFGGAISIGSPSSPEAGNPVLLATGAKLLDRLDYSDGPGRLQLWRHFNSQESQFTDVGGGYGAAGWRGVFPVYGKIDSVTGSAIKFTFRTEQGLKFEFIGNPTSAATITARGLGYSNARIRILLKPLFTPPTSTQAVNFFQTTDAQWLMRLGDGRSFVVSSTGASVPTSWQTVRPVKQTSADGYELAFAYTGTTLNSITAAGGRTMTFTKVITPGNQHLLVGLPDGTSLSYFYSVAGEFWSTFVTRLARVEHRRADNSLISTERYEYDEMAPLQLVRVFGPGDVLKSIYSYSGTRVKTSGKGDGSEKLTFAYDENSEPGFLKVTATNLMGRQTRYRFAYNSATDRTNPVLIAVDGLASPTCLGTTETWTVNSSDMVTASVARNGQRTEFVYDTKFRPTTIRRAAGSPLQTTETNTWHPDLNLPTKIVAPGQTADYTRDTLGRVTQLKLTDTKTQTLPYPTTGQTRTIDIAYGSIGRINSIDGPRTDVTDVTIFGYDAAENRTSITNPLGHQVQFELFDGNGRPHRMVDANGIATVFSYDDSGLLTESRLQSASGDVVTGYTYDADQRLTRLTLPDASWVGFEYDSADRVTATTNNAGERVEISYDTMGNQVGSTTKAAGGAIKQQLQFVRDELGRLRKVTAAAGDTTLGYDVEDNVTSVADPLGHATNLAFDVLNRTTTITDAANNPASLGYDAQDEVVTATDQRLLSTNYVRNGFGEDIQTASPDSGTTVIQRDKAGNVTSQTDARGTVVQISYDALNRITARQYPSTPAENVAFTYDDTALGNKGIGRLTGMTDQAGSTSYRYDDRGNLVSETRVTTGQTFTTSYTYDPVGRVASVTYPSGRMVTYTRDSVGQIAGVTTKANGTAPVQTVASSVSWLPFGPLSGFTHGNGIATSFTHDSDYRLTRITASSGTPVQDIQLVWDGASNIQSITDLVQPANSQTFTYDAVDRLTSAQGPYGTLSWTYDAVGNRLSEQKIAGATTNLTYAYPVTSNRLQSVTGGGVTRGFTYTPTGNVAIDDRGAQDDLIFTSNAANRLVTVASPTQALASMAYDGLGRRIQLISGTVTTKYHYDSTGRLIAISDASGNWSETVWLGDLPVAQVSGSNVYAIHSDQVGQPVKMSNASGALVWQRTAQPFGETYAESGSIATVLRFPGQVADAATATHYNMARDYDPTLGRYLQSDPIGLAGGWNTYAYVEGNPVSRIDPEGLNPTAVRGAIVVGEFAGDGLIWWCRSNMALCMRTIGPVAIGVAKVCDGVLEMAKGGRKKIENEFTREARSARPDDPCKWLNEKYNEATTSRADRRKIDAARKDLGCKRRGSMWNE